MRNLRKHEKADLRKYYPLFLEIGLITVLLIFIVAMKIDFQSNQVVTNLIEQQEIFKMEKVIQTKQIESPPPPPRPQIPVEVPNNEVIEDQVIDISADLDLDAQMELPPPPDDLSEETGEENFFIAVEQMPALIGGLASLQQNISYPNMARKAGIEGRVIV